MGLGNTSIDYMSRVSVISQRMQEFSMEKIIPLFAIASLDHDCYPGVKSRYLAGNPTLINCNLLDLSGLISRKETRQQALELLRSTPLYTSNRVSDAQAQPLSIGSAQPCPSQLTTTPSPVDYPPPRGVPRKCISNNGALQKIMNGLLPL